MARIACHQIAPRMGDLASNCAEISRAVRTSVASGADIVVVPELATSGYAFESREEVESVAVSTDHEVFEQWAEAAGHTAVVVAGFAEIAGDGKLYNSAAIVTRDGILAVYRKTHLWDREKLLFVPGSDVPPIVETSAGRLGVLICYDLEFPELIRYLALSGADLIVAPTNWGISPKPDGERPPELTNVMAAARLNHVAIACCDRAGPERGIEWTHGTAIVDENGWIVATPSPAEIGIATADLDITLSREKKRTSLSDTFKDRRPELYGKLIDEI